MATGNMGQLRGNRLSSFKLLATENKKTENNYVRLIKSRIKRQSLILRQEYRTHIAAQALCYIHGFIGDENRYSDFNRSPNGLLIGGRYSERGRPDSKQNDRLYLRYAPSFLESRHRGTLPIIPPVEAKARTERSDAFSKMAQAILDITIKSPYSQVESTFEAMQWDDDLAGGGMAKIVWVSKESSNKQEDTDDLEQISISSENAQRENESPEEAKVSVTDIDSVHLEVHRAGLGLLPDGIVKESLEEHIIIHEENSILVKNERPVLKRLDPMDYVYDTDNGSWALRTWEAEKRSIRVIDAISAGYKNINAENCGNERKEHQGSVPIEDITIQIWEYHDLLTNDWKIVAAGGPEEGLFLHQGAWIYGDINIYQPFMTRPQEPGLNYGIATADMMVPILDELARTDFYIQKHVRKHASYQMLAPRGAMDSRDKAALLDPNLDIANISPEAMAGMKEKKPPPIPETLLAYREILLSELRRVVGEDAQNTGASNQGVISATESGIREGSADSRRSHRQKRAGNFLEWVAKTFLSMYREFGTIPIMVRLMGPFGATYEKVSPTAIPEDLDIFLNVQAESPEQKNADFQKAKILFDSALASQAPIDTSMLLEWLFKKGGVDRPDRFRLAKPDGPENVETTTGSQPSLPNTSPRGGGPQPQQSSL